MMIDLQKNDVPLDLSYLSDMSGDNAEFMIEMIDMFKTQTPIYIAELRKAVQDQDWERVSSCAHKIKPTFSYIGRDDAKDHMQQMERYARELNCTDKLPLAFKEISDFVVILYKQLDDARAELEKKL